MDISKIGLISVCFRFNKDNYLTLTEIQDFIKENYGVKIDIRSIRVYIKQLIDCGFNIDIKVVAHNAKIYCFKDFNYDLGVEIFGES